MLAELSQSAPSSATEDLRPRRKEILVVGSVGVVFAAVWAASRGQDLGWDLQNYQYYTVYAWLHSRITYNIAPGQMQNWLNPLVYLPNYLLINHTPPIIATAIFGAVAGLNFLLVYLLARCVLPESRLWMAVAMSLACAGMGIADPVFLDALGSTNADVVISIFVLAGLLALCRSHRPETSPGSQTMGYGLCGLLLGAACGLKLTGFVYAAGLTVTLILLARLLGIGAPRLAVYAAGGVLGFLLTGGYWSWFLLRQYRNPIFPYFNSVFRSPWASAESLRDDRFLPETVQEAISYPFQWFVGLYSTHETRFWDARFALLAVLLPILLLAFAADRVSNRRSSFRQSDDGGHFVGKVHFWLIIVFFVSSYVLWLAIFSIQHYLMPVSLLIGLVLFLTVDRLLASNASKVAVLTAIAAFSILWSNSSPNKRFPYGSDWFGIEPAPPAISEPNTLFVLMGDSATSYLVPFMPNSDRFVRISGNFPIRARMRLSQMAREVITGHKGPIRSLTAAPLNSNDRLQLTRFGLVLSETGCATFHSRTSHFTSCPLVVRAHPVLAFEPRTRTISWNAPGVNTARIYVRMDNQSRQLVTQELEGDEEITWIQPGHRYVFDLVEWTGTEDGSLLGTVIVDEQGNVTTPPMPTAEITR